MLINNEKYFPSPCPNSPNSLLLPLPLLTKFLRSPPSSLSHRINFHFSPHLFSLSKFFWVLSYSSNSISLPSSFLPLPSHQILSQPSSLRQMIIVTIIFQHHSYRSFQGFVCLMQISTRDKDFLIDTLELRSELAVLNEVFTDPNILKVNVILAALSKSSKILVKNINTANCITNLKKYPCKSWCLPYGFILNCLSCVSLKLVCFFRYSFTNC